MVSIIVSLMVLVILRGQDLRLTYISRKRIMGLSFVFILILLIGLVLVFFGRQSIAFWIPGIDLLSLGE